MVFIDSFQRNLSPKKLKWIDARFLRVRIISALLRGPYRIHKFAQCGEGGSKIWKCCGRCKWNPALSSFSSHLSERRFLCSLTLRSTDRPTWTLKVIRRWMPRMPNDGTVVFNNGQEGNVLTFGNQVHTGYYYMMFPDSKNVVFVQILLRLTLLRRNLATLNL